MSGRGVINGTYHFLILDFFFSVAVEPGTGEVASQPGVAEVAKSFLAARAADSSRRKELHHRLEVRQQNEGAIRVRRGALLLREGAQARQEGARARQEGARALQEGAERCSWLCRSPGLALPAETIICSEEGGGCHILCISFCYYILLLGKYV